jgi:hypothetical protein
VPVPRFPRLTRFRPFWPFWLVRAGDFTVAKRPNVPVPRFLRFPQLARFRPFWLISLVRAGDFTVTHVTERARSTLSPFFPTCTFSPVLPVLAVFTGPRC